MSGACSRESDVVAHAHVIDARNTDRVAIHRIRRAMTGDEHRRQLDACASLVEPPALVGEADALRGTGRTRRQARRRPLLPSM